MFCTNCGTNVPDGATTCPNCGQPVGVQPTPVQPVPVQPTPVQPTPVQPNYNYEQPTQETYKQEAPGTTKIMVMGILAAALAWWPFTSIASIVLGAINMKNVNAYVGAGYPKSGQVTAGSITGKVGFIAGIVMTVFWAVYFGVIACIACADPFYYYW